MLTEKAFQNRKWGFYPTLRKILENKKLEAELNWIEDVDTFSELINRTIEIAELTKENKQEIIDNANLNGYKEFENDINVLKSKLECIKDYINRLIQDVTISNTSYVASKDENKLLKDLQICRYLNQYEELSQFEEKANISTNPDISEIISSMFFEKGNAFGDDSDQAIECYKKAIDSYPLNIDAYYNMGVNFLRKEDFDKSIECFQKVIDLNLKNQDAFFNMGLSYLKKEKFDKAVECYQKVIVINPHNYKAYNDLGIAYFNKGDHDKELECYRKAIEIKPDYKQAYANIGLSLIQQGKFDQAKKILEKSIEIGSVSIGNMHLGHFYLCTGDQLKAIECYKDGIQHSSNKELFKQEMKIDYKILVKHGINEANYMNIIEQI
jgi:tetratricopeptide (TPR) repeat protein